MRILVIEDNPRMAEAIQSGLAAQQYSVDVSHTGLDGENRAARDPYDAILLDVMLPDRRGVDVCRSLRDQGVKTPILMLTALSAIQDKVSGLDAGADDYLEKPFDFDELLARLRALLRRGQAADSFSVQHEDLELDLIKRKVKRAGLPIRVSAKEFALLEFFVRNPGRVLSRQDITREIWEVDYDPASNLIDVYISGLRKKIDKGFAHPLIHTVIGTGYRFGTGSE